MIILDLSQINRFNKPCKWSLSKWSLSVNDHSQQWSLSVNDNSQQGEWDWVEVPKWRRRHWLRRPKKTCKVFLVMILWLLSFLWWHWWWFVGMVNLSRLVSRLQPSAQRGHDPTSVQKRPETGETTKSLWLRKVSRNRKTDQIAFPVSRHFLYSGDFVVSPVPRHFWTGVGSGPLWAEPEIEKCILGHEEVQNPLNTAPNDPGSKLWECHGGNIDCFRLNSKSGSRKGKLKKKKEAESFEENIDASSEDVVDMTRVSSRFLPWTVLENDSYEIW